MESLAATADSPFFLADPVPCAVLDLDFVIRAVNPSFERVTGGRDDLVDVDVFEAFPDNPTDAGGSGAESLRRSLGRVRSTCREHDMVIQRHDLRATDGTDRWIEKHWSPLNAPLCEDGALVGIVLRVRDVTDLTEDAKRALENARALLERLPNPDSESGRSFARTVEIFSTALQRHAATLAEVSQLRRAITSRSVIDMAKGIVMAERRCGPDEAFGVLVKLASDTHVPVRDVAAALVQQAEGDVRR